MSPLEAIDHIDEVMKQEGVAFKTRQAWEVVKDDLLRMGRKVAEDIVLDFDCNACGHKMQIKVDGER
jgi:hypothetical protein